MEDRLVIPTGPYGTSTVRYGPVVMLLALSLCTCLACPFLTSHVHLGLAVSRQSQAFQPVHTLVS